MRSIQAVADVRVALGDRQISLAGDNLRSLWPALSEPDKRVLLPYLIDYAADSGGAARRSEILGLLKPESDSFLQAGAAIAGIYFQSSDPAARIRALGTVQAGGASGSPLVAFFQAVEQARTGQKVAADRFAGICKFPEQRDLCSLVKLKQAAERSRAAQTFRAEHLYEIMRTGRPLLGRNPSKPAFYSLVGADIPEYLFEVGLPLEAAILAERMTVGAETAWDRQIRARIPYYLAGAADFDSALRFSDKLSGDGVLRNARLDWLILAGRYSEALNYISQVGAEQLANRNYAGDRDYWSGFSTSREELQLRGAMLLYLAGDVKKAASALERLTGIHGRTSTGEPAGQYARLRMAQILLRENPELAHKLAEDVTYIAQENQWHVLEYRATIIDGWAGIYMGQHYRAVINFIKARGILPHDLQEYGAEYSRLLGLLTARNRMNARGNYSALIGQINNLLQSRPYNEAIFTIREWAPREAGPDMFLLEAVRNFNLRGRRWDALNLLIEYAATDEYFFRPGGNPGGYRGFLTSALWSQELTKFAYISRSPFAGLAVGAASKQGATGLLPKTGERNLGPRSFGAGQTYVFSFAVEGGRYVYMVYPAGRSAGIDYIFLQTEVAYNIRQGCRFAGQTAEGCRSFAGEFDSLRKHASAGSTLLVHYSPAFDPDYGSLIFDSRGPAATIHFYHPSVLPGRGSRAAGVVREGRVYRPAGCSAALAYDSALPVADFEARFTREDSRATGSRGGGVWLWPLGLDSVLTGNGNRRPVYLRKFICGKSRLRLWDMDRFAGPEQEGRGEPELIVYRRRADDDGLDRAFARYFADRGASLLEFQAAPGESDTGRILNGIRAGGQNLIELYRTTVGGDRRGHVRLILPGIPG